MSEHQPNMAVVAGALSSDPRAAAEISRKMGLRGLQFDLVSGTLDLTTLSASGRREFQRVLSNQNQQLVGLRLDLGLKGFAPGGDIDRQLAGLERAMNTAAELSAALVCVDIGPLPEPPRQAPPKPKITSEMAGLILIPDLTEATEPQAGPEPARPPSAADLALASQVDDALMELGRRADRYSVILAFRSELASFAAIERALIAADCPWFGVDLDPAAIVRDEWSIDEALSRLGHLVRHVRGRDAIGGAGGRSRPAILGQGDTRWAELLPNLDGAGYHGWITLDPIDLPDRAAGARIGFHHLESLIHRQTP